MEDAPEQREHLGPVTPEMRSYVLALKATLAPWVSCHPTSPIQLVRTFVQISLSEGCTVGELAAKCDTDPGVMSRHVSLLGLKGRLGTNGLGFVALSQRVHGDRRERRVVLTDRGAAMAREMADTLRLFHPLRKRHRGRRKSVQRPSDSLVASHVGHMQHGRS